MGHTVNFDVTNICNKDVSTLCLASGLGDLTCVGGALLMVFRARWIFGGGLTTGEVPSEEDEEEEELEDGRDLLAKVEELMVAVLGDGDEEQKEADDDAVRFFAALPTREQTRHGKTS